MEQIVNYAEHALVQKRIAKGSDDREPKACNNQFFSSKMEESMAASAFGFVFILCRCNKRFDWGSESSLQASISDPYQRDSSLTFEQGSLLGDFR